MTKSMRFSSWPAALLLLVGCAPQSDFSGVTTSPITMLCDGGQTFTIAYANNFETAFVETEGQRLELPRLPTASSITTTQRGFGALSRARSSGGRDDLRRLDQEDFGRVPGLVDEAGSTGVRYGRADALLIRRNQGAVLQVGDDTYSNCQVART